MIIKIDSKLNYDWFQERLPSGTEENVAQIQITNSNRQNNQNSTAHVIRIENDTRSVSPQNQRARVEELPTVWKDNDLPSYEDLFPQTSSHK